MLDGPVDHDDAESLRRLDEAVRVFSALVQLDAVDVKALVHMEST